eukprot:2683351-Amphidinium_carterae.4
MLLVPDQCPHSAARAGPYELAAILTHQSVAQALGMHILQRADISPGSTGSAPGCCQLTHT